MQIAVVGSFGEGGLEVGHGLRIPAQLETTAPEQGQPGARVRVLALFRGGLDQERDGCRATAFASQRGAVFRPSGRGQHAT